MPFSIYPVCSSCGAKNRVPAAHLADTGRCGSCKVVLPPLGVPLDVNAAAFNEVVAGAKVPVLVDFWASWCGPCKMAAPEVHQLAKEMQGKALVLKVNTEEEQQLSARYRVQSIPNFIVFRGGRPVFQKAGLVGRAEMRSWLA